MRDGHTPVVDLASEHLRDRVHRDVLQFRDEYLLVRCRTDIGWSQRQYGHVDKQPHQQRHVFFLRGMMRERVFGDACVMCRDVERGADNKIGRGMPLHDVCYISR